MLVGLTEIQFFCYLIKTRLGNCILFLVLGKRSYLYHSLDFATI